ncbi:MAG: hypothetical protein IQL11_16930, partial [Bacteroidales bacterium]|nr:hypothetical protein [Bacteroidales bacterium]
MNHENYRYIQMKRNNKILNVILAGGFSAVLLLSCDRTRTMRGYDFIPDMAYSRAYETYSDNPNFADSMTMRVPEGNSVPQGFLP